MKDDLVEQIAREIYHSTPRNRPYEHLMLNKKNELRSQARAALSIARPAILEEAAAEADVLADRHDVAAIGAIFDVGVAKYRGAETALRCFAKRLRALATTGQEGGR